MREGEYQSSSSQRQIIFPFACSQAKFNFSPIVRFETRKYRIRGLSSMVVGTLPSSTMINSVSDTVCFKKDSIAQPIKCCRLPVGIIHDTRISPTSSSELRGPYPQTFQGFASLHNRS